VAVAYLINQYPQPTQSFIRREIVALEKLGVHVERFTLRKFDKELVDPRDRAEQMKTRAVLDVGGVGLLTATLKAAFARPVPFMRALAASLRAGVGSHRGLALHLVYLAEACVLLRWCRDANVSHVHSHFGTNSTMVAMLLKMLGGPSYSFTSHGPEEYDKPESISLTEKIRNSAFVIAICEFGRSQLCRWCKYEEWPKCLVVRCGVDEMFLAAAEELDGKLPPITETKRVVAVGRIDCNKGQSLLVEAAAKLTAEGHDFEIVLAGDGAFRPHVEQLIAKLDVGKFVRVTGWISNDQVRQEILNSRAMALPSFAEGLPLVIMESLALHRPVISTYVAGIPELVTPDCGWLVPAGSVDALTNALRELFESPTSRLEEMGKAGAKRVAASHDVNKEAARLAELFRSFN
jgi:glycosyltransferase involved in cell wall biosynthesis